MQAACELENEALGAFFFDIYIYFFFNRHIAVFHFLLKLDSFSTSLLEIPSPALLNQ